jgi:hypothetical protein
VLDRFQYLPLHFGECAEKNWRKLRGFVYLAKVIDGIEFVNGEEVKQTDQVAP